MDINCKNCGNGVENKFCSFCGQSSKIEAINLHFFLHELQHSIFHLDKGILYTAKQMCIRPGHTIREYIEGKRVKHFKPISYIFILSTIYSLLLYVMGKDNFFKMFLDGFSNVQSENGRINFVSWITWLVEHYAVSMLLLVPVYSLSTFLVFIERGNNFIQHLVINSYVYGQCTLFYMLISCFQYVFVANEGNDFYELLKLFISFFFTMLVFIQFYNSHVKWKTMLLYLLSNLLYAILLGLITIVALAVSEFLLN